MRAHRVLPWLIRLRLPAATIALTGVAGALLLALRPPAAASAPSPSATPVRLAASASARGVRPGVVGLQAIAASPLTARSTAPTPTPLPTPTPTVPPPRTEVITYSVQPGDNLWIIAQHFDLEQDTIVWANADLERNPDLLQIGQEIRIPPVDGVLHTVAAGESLEAIASRYKVEPAQILAYAPNGIDDASALQPGQELIVPGGVRPPPPRPTPAPVAQGEVLAIPAGAPAVPVEAPAQPGRFIWPAQGIITQWYGPWHGAIDIANSQGTPLLAADAGTVTFAGWSGGLGNTVQIDHQDGFATTYAHLYSIDVEVGQQVEQGQQIGLMGTTGRSTGPHLHLILTYQGGIVNPMDYLP
jgi:murein DD-endopeptidase MepM/ murein hydrolase activator NlpD